MVAVSMGRVGVVKTGKAKRVAAVMVEMRVAKEGPREEAGEEKERVAAVTVTAIWVAMRAAAARMAAS